MIGSIKNKINQVINRVNSGVINQVQYNLIENSKKDEALLHLTAKLLIDTHKKNENEILKNIRLAEFKVYSQWGDDGIIQFLINYLDIKHKTFIEFGVENYTECNTRFLLVNNNWKGLIFDGSEKNITAIKKDNFYWQYNLTAECEFITTENINHLIKKNNFSGKVGILHIDIDGNDYHVWRAITEVEADIVIMEYNSVFGIKNPWTVQYDATFYRTNFHYSNLYFGSSLLSLCDLGEEKGYLFIGCNSAGNNAYFIKKEIIKNIEPKTPQDGYVESMFREGRNSEGQLTYVSGNNRIKELIGLEILNTRTDKIEKIK